MDHKILKALILLLVYVTGVFDHIVLGMYLCCVAVYMTTKPL